jgi:nucleotide-binding universal stress UspA family protein
MLKLLVPVEENEIRAEMIGALVGWLRRIETPHQIHLIHVQPAIHGDVSMFLSHDQIQDYLREDGMKELEGTMKQLDAESIAYEHHICVGDPAEVIAQFAKQNEMHQIVIGYRSFNALVGLLRSSLHARVLELADIPVMLIK